MANQPEAAQWDDGVYQLETTDPVDGGLGAVSNKPLLNLANRTAYLKKHLDNLENGTTLIDAYATKESPSLTGTPTSVTQAIGDASTKIATDEFVNRAVNGVASVNVAGNASTTLTQAQAGMAAVVLTGAVTANKSVIFPAAAGNWIVANSTTGDFTITLKTASGTGVTITRGRIALIWCDGTNIIYQQTDFIDTGLLGTPTAPTAASGSNTAQIANTAFVQAALALLGSGTQNAQALTDFNTATTGGLYRSDASSPAANAPISGASPISAVVVPYNATGTLQVAANLTSAAASLRLFWRTQANGSWSSWREVSPLDSPVFTGMPKAPTPNKFNYGTQLATTDFVKQNAGNFYSFNAISANYIFQPADCGSYWVTNVGSGDVVATLPTANSVPAGTALTITHSSGSMNSFSIIAQSGDYLIMDGLSDNLGKYALVPNETLQLVSTGGTSWKFVFSNGPLFLKKGISQLKGQVRYGGNASFTVPAGVTTMYLSGCAGGGGGGGGAGYDSLSGGGGGGGAGYIAVRVPVAVTPGQVYNIVIGGAGAAGASGGNGGNGGNGTAGGNTTVTLAGATSSVLSLQGGAGGMGGWVAAGSGAGGAAGTPGGSCGTDGRNAGQGGDGGAGGSGPYGVAGGSGRAGAGRGASATTAVGFGTGGGGGGACYSSAGPGGAGSSGMPGLIIIEW